MQFKPYGRHHYEITPRKHSAAARALARERQALPLFADQIAEAQEAAGGIDGRLERRRQAIDATTAAMRAFHARTWREGRALFYAMSPNYRAILRAYWDQSHYPRTAVYFTDLVRRVYAGHLDPAKELAVIERVSALGAAAAKRQADNVTKCN